MINTDSIEITPMTMKDSDTFSFFNYWGKCGPVTIVEKIILIGIRHVQTGPFHLNKTTAG